MRAGVPRQVAREGEVGGFGVARVGYGDAEFLVFLGVALELVAGGGVADGDADALELDRRGGFASTFSRLKAATVQSTVLTGPRG